MRIYWGSSWATPILMKAWMWFRCRPTSFYFCTTSGTISKEQGNSFAYEIVRTYIHEVGHFLGYDEEDLIKRCLD